MGLGHCWMPACSLALTMGMLVGSTSVGRDSRTPVESLLTPPSLAALPHHSRPQFVTTKETKAKAWGERHSRPHFPLLVLSCLAAISIALNT